MKGNVGDANPSSNILAPGSLKGPGTRGNPSRQTAGETGSDGATDYENLVVALYAAGSGSVLVLGRASGWRCYAPSRKRPIFGVWGAANRSNQRLRPSQAFVSVPSRPLSWPALRRRPLLYTADVSEKPNACRVL